MLNVARTYRNGYTVFDGSDFSPFSTVLFGLVYLFRSSFLNYHKEAIQKDWVEITPVFQILILALMRAVSGGAIAVGLSIIVLPYYFTKTNLAWIPLIILSSGLIISLCFFICYAAGQVENPGQTAPGDNIHKPVTADCRLLFNKLIFIIRNINTSIISVLAGSGGYLLRLAINSIRECTCRML